MVDWERVVREDGPAAWRTACRLLGNRQDAQECVQDAFVEAIALSRRQPVKNARALLLHVVTVRAMDRLRRKYRRHSVDPPGDFQAVADDCPRPDVRAENAELLEKLRAALPALPTQQSQAFVLH
jgi:RNA polymerase sigma factor (sigma-70 family)